MGSADIRLALTGVLIPLGSPCEVGPDERLTGVLLMTLGKTGILSTDTEVEWAARESEQLCS